MEVLVKSPSFVTNDDINKKPKFSSDHREEEANGDVKFPNDTREKGEDLTRSFSQGAKNSTFSKHEDKLESTRAEMGEVREENERLKTMLARMVKDYQSLQAQLHKTTTTTTTTTTQTNKSSDPTTQTSSSTISTTPDQQMEVEEEEDDDDDDAGLVSLSLGTTSTTSSGHKKRGKAIGTVETTPKGSGNEGLTLGLECGFGVGAQNKSYSIENGSKEVKDEEAREAWQPSKILKTCVRDGDDHDDVAQQIHVKKARVSVRARCDAPTMNDGCQWRKYGQKISKGNPCPRAYYRCTIAPACPVRKQVQRCSEDMSILITTYEGNHNHPLPMAATAMASTTSAAASMLLSGSSVSQSGMVTAGLHHGLNFSLSDTSRGRQFYFPPNPTISSTITPYQTITLDLTTPPSSQPLLAPQFNRLPTNYTSPTPRYSPTSFNFSSGTDTTALPSSWSGGYMGYGAPQVYNNTSKSTTQTYYQPTHLQKSITPPTPTTNNALTDTIAKAITTDPSFQSALAAAITSIVGANGKEGNNTSVGEVMGKWGSSSVPTANGSGCASSKGNNLFLQTSLALSSNKNSSALPVENGENKS